MSALRYKTMPDGNGLVDTKKGVTIKVASFAVVRSGRHPVVKITDRDGKKYAIARYTIDESAYSYGGDGKTDAGELPDQDNKVSRKRGRKPRTQTTPAIAAIMRANRGTLPQNPAPADVGGILDLLRAQAYSRVDEWVEQLRMVLAR